MSLFQYSDLKHPKYLVFIKEHSMSIN